MSSKLSGLVTAMSGAVCLFGSGFMAVVITVGIFRHSLHSFALWLSVAMLSVLALYGLWVVRMAVMDPRPDGKEKRRVDKGPGRRGAQPARPGKRTRRSPDPKPGLAGGPA